MEFKDAEILMANKSHISEIIDLRIEMLREIGNITYETSIDHYRFALEAYFSNSLPNQEFVAFIAILKEKIVGMSGLCFYRKPPTGQNISGKEAYLMNMYTLPSFRKQGMARELLKQCLEYCRTQQISVIRLHAEPAAETLYRGIGFQKEEKEMVYRS